MTGWWAQYVGAPFAAGGRGPQYDCWGLIVAIYRRHLGIVLPDYGEISAHDLARVAREMATGKDGDGWRPVDVPQAFDVALMRSGRGGRLVVHVGVMVDGRRLLHVEAASAAVVVPVTHISVAGRIMGYRRHADCPRDIS